MTTTVLPRPELNLTAGHPINLSLTENNSPAVTSFGQFYIGSSSCQHNKDDTFTGPQPPADISQTITNATPTTISNRPVTLILSNKPRSSEPSLVQPSNPTECQGRFRIQDTLASPDDGVQKEGIEGEHVDVISQTRDSGEGRAAATAADVVACGGREGGVDGHGIAMHKFEDRDISMVDLTSVPNGGWGWMVVLGSFFCLFVVDGLCCCYGIYLHQMLSDRAFAERLPPASPSGGGGGGGQHMKVASLAELSLPGSLLGGTCIFIGPIAGALVDRYSYRSVAMLGAILATVCTFLSATLVDSLPWFTVVFGLFGGIGCGLIYLPAITVIGTWFDKRRAFVVGLVLCGGGLGTALLATLVIQPLSETFNWRGALVLIAGLFAQTMVGISLFRPLDIHERIMAAQRRRHRIQLALMEVKRRRVMEEQHKLQRTNKAHRLGTGSQASSKRPTERKTMLQRGSIMARILEEKSRQRTTSTGSLDGMVITRSNELVALSSPEACEQVKAAAAAYVAMRDQLPAAPHTGAQTSSLAGSLTVSETRTSPLEAVACPLTVAPVNLQPLKEDVSLPSLASPSAPPTAILPPPIYFNRIAVRRIALAIIGKLRAAHLLASPYQSNAHMQRHPRRLSATSTGPPRGNSSISLDTPSRGAVIVPPITATLSPPPLVEGADDVASLDPAGTVPPSKHHSTGYPVVESGEPSSPCGDGLPQSAIDVTLRARDTDSGVVDTTQWQRNTGLSSVYSIRPSPSRLESVVSLDSITGNLIARELLGLPLDDATKAAIIRAVRQELVRPRHRVDSLCLDGGHVTNIRLTGASRFTNSNGPPSSLAASRISSGYGSNRPQPRFTGDLEFEPGLTKPTSYPPPSGTGTHNLPGHSPDSFQYHDLMSPESNWDVAYGNPPAATNNRQDWRETVDYLRDMFHPYLLTSPTFLLLLVACFANMFLLMVPYHYLPLLLELAGVECEHNVLWCPDGLPSKRRAMLAHRRPNSGTSPRQLPTFFLDPASVLLTAGLAHIAGRMLAAMYIEKGFGVQRGCSLRCRKLTDPILLTNVSLIISGLAVACFPFAIHGVITTEPRTSPRRMLKTDSDDFRIQAWSFDARVFLFYAATAIFGVASAIGPSLRSVLLVDLFGIQHLTNAFGYLMIFQGLAMASGPPLFGLFCDSVCAAELPALVGGATRLPQQTTQCAYRLIWSFYLCAGLFCATSLLFIPLRWLSRRDCWSKREQLSQIDQQQQQWSTTVSGVGPWDQVTAEVYMMRSIAASGHRMHTGERGGSYDPQDTQMTHILPVLSVDSVIT